MSTIAQTRTAPAGAPHRRAATLALLGACVALHGCGERDAGGGGASGGGAGDGDEVAACPVADMNAVVDANMRDYYLFADRVPGLDPDAYASPEALIRALRVAPDRFSYVTDAAQSAAFFDEGVTVDYGWILERDAAGRPVIALVQPGSPLDEAGVRRGETLLAIDGTAVADIASAAQADALLGTGREVRTIRLSLGDAAGNVREVDVTRGEFDVRAVIDVRTLEPSGPGGPRVGYLHLLTFIETARAELDAAFEYLASENVDELVLDLRYNGGGRISVAETLASRIVGAGADGRDFTRFRFNDAYQAAYEAQGLADELRLPFEPLPDSLDLPRVHVLGTDRTCSASEMLVNALEPLMDVVVVGGASCGKPFGTSGARVLRQGHARRRVRVRQRRGRGRLRRRDPGRLRGERRPGPGARRPGRGDARGRAGAHRRRHLRGRVRRCAGRVRRVRRGRRAPRPRRPPAAGRADEPVPQRAVRGLRPRARAGPGRRGGPRTAPYSRS